MWKTVLFDVDGTLVDSNAAHARAWQEAFAEQGYDISFERVFPIVGLGGDKLLATLVPGLSDTDGVGRLIARQRKEIFLHRYLSSVKPTPGARALVERVQQEGMQPVVASSAEQDELRELLRAASVEDLIEVQASASDAEGSKPDPDIVQAALEKSGSAPDESIMIGDTQYDIEAARKSGVASVAFRSGGHDADLQGALAVYDNPADLLEHWDESPLAHQRAIAG